MISLDIAIYLYKGEDNKENKNYQEKCTLELKLRTKYLNIYL